MLLVEVCWRGVALAGEKMMVLKGLKERVAGDALLCACDGKDGLLKSSGKDQIV